VLIFTKIRGSRSFFGDFGFAILGKIFVVC